MLCTNPRDSKLLAGGRVRDGIRAAEQAQLPRGMRRVTVARRGGISGPIHLVQSDEETIGAESGWGVG
jgi:hypothetical protein